MRRSYRPRRKRPAEATSKEFIAAIMSGDTNRDGKLSREEIMAWIADPKTALADGKMLAKWMDMFASSYGV